ncbi:MAG: transcription elongation factor GreA [Planctomycetota bacterium]
MNRIPMTREGYEQILRQLDHLKNVELPRLQRALGEARELGDLSENAEFDAARTELWNVDQRIAELEQKVALAEVIDPASVKLDVIAIGAFVQAEDLDTRRREEFLLVGEGEVRRDVDTVSVASPLGQAFLGKKVGDVAEVQAPRGLLRFRILEFRYG